MRNVTPAELAALREMLSFATDEQLGRFLESYAMGHIAGALIASMTPDARSGFFGSMRTEYPEHFGTFPSGEVPS